MGTQDFPAESFWQHMLNDARIRAIAIQLLVLAILFWVAYYAIANTSQNLKNAGIASGFDFLSQPAGFDISMSFIHYTRTSTYAHAYLVGLLNTLAMTAICIVTSTLVGFFTAVFRLSPNWLMSFLAGAYIEIARNIPLLLLILFVYLAVLSPLPGPRQAIDFNNIIYLCNRGLVIPQIIWQASASSIGWALLATLLACFGLRTWAKKRHKQTGKTFPTLLVSCMALLLVAVAGGLVAGNPIAWEIPKLAGFNFKGGITLLPEFLALCLAMTIYMGAFLGENIRAGILAIPSGQLEAAAALGLKPGAVLRFVVIPQALQVIIPPVASQYLTLAKNISLGVVIGYPDLISVFAGTTLNQTGQAVEVVALTMLTYLLISIVISMLMNWYNNSIAIRER